MLVLIAGNAVEEIFTALFYCEMQVRFRKSYNQQ
jgi:hypothetical protein